MIDSEEAEVSAVFGTAGGMRTVILSKVPRPASDGLITNAFSLILLRHSLSSSDFVSCTTRKIVIGITSH